MATQTTYYEFIKPEGTDLVNPLVDTNPNWDALDADLHEFNERSIANCTEVVSLGVHTISRLDTTAKFLKWIATANFTAGETFTVDGLPVAATTPAGASLASNAYVTGSIVLACLNADNTAMTVYVSGTTVASDAERLGGELPSYYGTASDVSDNAFDITNLQNQMGNTSIVGIGDGTATGAIDAINTDISNKLSSIYSSSEEKVGTWLGADLYRKCYENTSSHSSIFVLDSSLTTANTEIVSFEGSYKESNQWYPFTRFIDSGTVRGCRPILLSSGLNLQVENYTITKARVIVYYTKIS